MVMSKTHTKRNEKHSYTFDENCLYRYSSYLDEGLEKDRGVKRPPSTTKNKREAHS